MAPTHILEWHIQEAGARGQLQLRPRGSSTTTATALTGAVFATPEGLVRVNAAKARCCHRGYAANPEMIRANLPLGPRLLYRR